MFASGEINDYTISEAAAQSKINSKVSPEEPWEKTKEIFLVDFTVGVSRADVEFHKGEISLSFDAYAIGLKARADIVNASATGSIHFNQSAGTFHFVLKENTRLEYEEMSVQGAETPDRFEEPIKNAISWVIEKYLENRPVYTLGDDIKQQAVKWLLDRVEINEGSATAYLSVGRFALNAFLFFVMWVLIITAVIATVGAMLMF